MKIALLSDIHANRQALDACLQHARAQGAEQFALLGDLVGYGGEPVAVDAEVDLGPITGGYGIAVRLQVHLPGMDRAAAQALVDAAHKVCPYSNATRGNIDVTITLG